MTTGGGNFRLAPLRCQIAQPDVQLAQLLFVAFLGLLKEQVGKPLTVILDNASIHKAKATRHVVEYLKNQGVTLYFLPAYNPELNCIERLWHKIKHTWMEVKCRTKEMLEADVSHILDHFGTTYKFNF